MMMMTLILCLQAPRFSTTMREWREAAMPGGHSEAERAYRWMALASVRRRHPHPHPRLHLPPHQCGTAAASLPVVAVVAVVARAMMAPQGYGPSEYYAHEAVVVAVR
jgi:hypothetical protein